MFVYLNKNYSLVNMVMKFIQASINFRIWLIYLSNLIKFRKHGFVKFKILILTTSL